MQNNFSNGPTFILRNICDKIQANTNQLLLSIQDLSIQKIILPSNQLNSNNNEKNIPLQQLSNFSKQIYFKQSFVQTIKNYLYRIVSAQLPQVVNYETKINDKIQNLEDQIENLKQSLKTQKINLIQSIKEKNYLQVKMLQFQHHRKQLQKEIDSYSQKYNEAIALVEKKMKQVQRIESQNVILKKNRQETLKEDNKLSFLYDKTLSSTFGFSKQELFEQRNISLQIKEKLNQAQKSSDCGQNSFKIEKNDEQLINDIVGCQKQLLQIELKKSSKQKVEFWIQLQQQRNYRNSLQIKIQNLSIQVQNLQKLLDGEKKLNQKLDRQLYSLINLTKEIKIQLLQEKNKNHQNYNQIQLLQQTLETYQKDQTQLENKITKQNNQLKQIHIIQDQLQHLQNQLEISHQKYQELRKAKSELDDKLEDLQHKLIQSQQKQTELQIKTITFQKNLESSNTSKIKNIEEMAMSIKQKYQQKISIMKKHYCQLKDKYKFMKQQNSRLYEGFQIQSRKEENLEEKYSKIKICKQSIQHQLDITKQNNLLLEKQLKNQTLLGKQMKKQLLTVQMQKQVLAKKFKRLQTSVIPHLLAMIKIMRAQLSAIKATITNNNQTIAKAAQSNYRQFLIKLNSVSTFIEEKKLTIEINSNKQNTLIQHWKKQFENLQNQKIKLLERLDSLELNQSRLLLQIKEKNQQILNANVKVQVLQTKNKNLQKQLQSNRKNDLQKMQSILNQQNEVQKFYDFVESLTEQNQNLRTRLQNILHQNQHIMNYDNSTKSNQSQSGYLLRPQKVEKQKTKQKKLKQIANSNHSYSCGHLKPSYKQKSSTLFELSQTQSGDKFRKQAKNLYSEASSHLIPIHQNLNELDFQLKQKCLEPVSTPATSDLHLPMNFQNFKQTINLNYQNQKLRLDKAKNQYDKMMISKFNRN